MRTFIAIELDGRILDHIDAIRDRLRAVGADVKWVQRANTHLTVKFIGETAPELVAGIAAALGEAAAESDAFDIEVCGVGTFPPRRPAVLWVGVRAELGGPLARLHEAIESRLQKLGIAKENRRFSPHITLGRVRGGRHVRKLLAALENEQPADMGRSPVASVILFESKLTPEGPVYNRLAEAPLHQRSGH